jgi:hypothetical protein
MRNLLKLLHGATLHLSLSKAGAGLAYAPYPWRHRAIPLLEAAMDDAVAFDPVALAASLAPALGDRRHAGLALSVTISDEWVRLFMVEPPKNAFRMQDVRTAAAMRFHTLYGDNPAAWRITCDDAVDRRFLACAMPSSLFSAIQSLSETYGLRLVSLAPVFVSTWNGAYRRLGRAWFGVVDAETMTIGCVEAAPAPALAAVHRLRLPTAYDGPWLAYQIRGTALRHGLGNPQELQLFGRYVPGLHSFGKETGLAVIWPERPAPDRPMREPRINLSGIGGAQA